MTLNEFRESARRENLCAEFSQKWDSCRNKKQLMDLILNIKGVDYVSDAYNRGYGMTSKDYQELFPQFINGKYTYDDGYTSQFYCLYDSKIHFDSDIMLIMDCDMEISCIDGKIHEIYASGVCNLHLTGKGRIYIFAYCNPSDITVTGDADYSIRIKQERDDHE